MSSVDSARAWVAEAPYSRALGVVVDDLSGEAARLRLPYRDENSNPGKALHGGCAASLAAIGAQAVARACLGEAAGPWHACELQVSYLAAAIGEEVVADARLLRKGKELCFVEVLISTPEGKAIAQASAAVRGRFGAEAPSQLAAARGDDGASDPGPMGPHIGRIPFIAARGIRIDHMQGGRSRLVMPQSGTNADLGDDGAAAGVHEGAVLALLDTAGAMASWAETGPGRYKASTPAIQAQFLRPPPKGDLVAYGQVVQRDREIFFSDVEVADLSDGRLCARGTVLYRILT